MVCRKILFGAASILLAAPLCLQASIITVLDGQTLEVSFEIPDPPNEYIESELAKVEIFNFTIPLLSPVNGRTYPVNSINSDVTIELYDGRRRIGRKETVYALANFASRESLLEEDSSSPSAPDHVNFDSFQNGSIDGLIKFTTSTPGSGYQVNTDHIILSLGLDVEVYSGNSYSYTSYWNTQDLLKDVEVTGKAKPHQVLFLNFDSGTAGLSFDPLTQLSVKELRGADTDAFAYKQDEFAAPNQFKLDSESSSEATMRIKNQITRLVQNEFYEYGIEVVNQRPTTGEYSTVFMSQTNLDSLGFLNGLVGFAEHVDWFKNDLSDDAIVILDRIENLSFVTDSESYAQAVAKTVEHEVGHLLGLVHVEDSTKEEIMIDTISDSDGDFTTRKLNVVEQGPVQGFVQSSDCSIRNALELTKPRGCPGALSQIAAMYSLGLSLPNIYDLGVGFTFSDDAFATFVDIGSLLTGQSLEFDLPIGFTSFYFAGKSIEGGEIDIFGSPIASIDPDNATFEDFIFNSPLVLDDVYFYKLSNDNIESIGRAQMKITTVSSPASLFLIVLGFLGMRYTAGKTSIRSD